MRVYINEVAPRDGFQNEQCFIDTDKKIEFINQLSRCGYNKIEVSSFTSPKAIPALRDAEQVMTAIERNPNVIYTALVPNLKGAERALSCKVDEINLVMSCSEAHNQSNLRMSKQQSQDQLKAIIQSINKQCEINISLSTAFGCPIQKDVPFADVLTLVHFFLSLAYQSLRYVILQVWHIPHKSKHFLLLFYSNFPILKSLLISITHEGSLWLILSPVSKVELFALMPLLGGLEAVPTPLELRAILVQKI